MSDQFSVLVNRIESTIHQDVGNRGIGRLFAESAKQSALLQCVNHLAAPTTMNIAITTGFSLPPPETDGPPGAVAIGRALHALGKNVVFVTDDSNEHALRNAMTVAGLHDACKLYVFRTQVGILKCSVGSATTASDVEDQWAAYLKTNELDFDVENKKLAEDILLSNDIHHVVAIERLGPTADNRFYSMRGRDITHITGRADLLFTAIHKARAGEGNERFRDIQLTGIGDGGNELGMGNYVELVKKDVPQGNKIACCVPSDYGIVAGVSNWAGYAVASALAVLSALSGSDATLITSILPNNEDEIALLQSLIANCGVIDGVLGTPSVSVDGFPYVGVHSGIVDALRAIVLEPIKSPTAT